MVTLHGSFGYLQNAALKISFWIQLHTIFTAKLSSSHLADERWQINLLRFMDGLDYSTVLSSVFFYCKDLNNKNVSRSRFSDNVHSKMRQYLSILRWYTERQRHPFINQLFMVKGILSEVEQLIYWVLHRTKLWMYLKILLIRMNSQIKACDAPDLEMCIEHMRKKYIMQEYKINLVYHQEIKRTINFGKI